MLAKKAKSSVGEGIEMKGGQWNFGGDVAETFSDHVRKSVPLYDEGHSLACKISDFFLHDESTCYELGSATGVLLKKIAAYQKGRNIKWIGIDAEKSMVDKARENCNELGDIEFVNSDIFTYEYEPSNFIISYYTLQFVPPHIRQEMYQKIYDTLNWGGGFLLFEKVRAPDARFQDLACALYNDFKTDQGYSDEEIMSKSRSLRGAMEPFSTEGNIGLLERAGFTDMMTVMKFVCFEGILAIK